MKEKKSIIKSLWLSHSYELIGSKVEMSADAVRKMGKRMGLPSKEPQKSNHKEKLSPEVEIKRDAVVGHLNEEKKQTQRKYELVAEELANSEAMLEAFKIIKPINSYTIKSEPSGLVNEATAVCVLSDVHFAETVHSENVNGRNEYNTRIAKARMEKFFTSIVKLLNIFKKESKIQNLVLALLGDLINGQLREEAMENNSMQPMEEVLAVKEILSSGIKYLLDHTSVNLVIPCHSGNHARISKKIHVSTEAGNSLEYVLYQCLAWDFKGNDRVKFIIPKSYHSYLDVGGITIRFHHGHSIRYSGGVGGIFIPVKKAVSQWNKAKYANLDVFGHMHQLRDGGDFLSNGSVVGWNEFGSFIKADFEKPKQLFFLVDHRRQERTITTSVFLE